MKYRWNIHRSVWKLLACWKHSKWRYHGNWGTKTMGWDDVRYCFAMAILVLIIIIIILSFFLPSKVCPTHLSEMPWSNFMKPCRNIICHVKLCLYGLMFSKWLSLPWKRPKCKKIEKHKYDHSRLLAEQKLMKLDRNNIHIKWNKISKKNRNWLNKLCCSCHGKRGF